MGKTKLKQLCQNENVVNACEDKCKGIVIDTLTPLQGITDVLNKIFAEVNPDYVLYSVEDIGMLVYKCHYLCISILIYVNKECNVIGIDYWYDDDSRYMLNFYEVVTGKDITYSMTKPDKPYDSLCEISIELNRVYVAPIADIVAEIFKMNISVCDGYDFVGEEFVDGARHYID